MPLVKRFRLWLRSWLGIELQEIAIAEHERRINAVNATCIATINKQFGDYQEVSRGDRGVVLQRINAIDHRLGRLEGRNMRRDEEDRLGPPLPGFQS